jgi:hypothetical protein
MHRRELAVAETLARGAAKGLWSLEALDKPSLGMDELERDRVKSMVPRDTRNPNDRRCIPTMGYPDAGTYHKPRNLAREWIAANPQQWDTIQAPDSPAEAPESGYGTPGSRQAAATTLAGFEARQSAGKLAPTLDTDTPYGQGVRFAEVLDGPIGTTLPDHVANRQHNG